jgi:hypothetical protein
VVSKQRFVFGCVRKRRNDRDETLVSIQGKSKEKKSSGLVEELVALQIEEVEVCCSRVIFTHIEERNIEWGFVVKVKANAPCPSSERVDRFQRHLLALCNHLQSK